jgi:hypothetical protein
MPALFISVSIRPKRSMALSTTRTAVAGSLMSPSILRVGSSLRNSVFMIERDVATTP